jgi:hypothetical protein
MKNFFGDLFDQHRSPGARSSGAQQDDVFPFPHFGPSLRQYRQIRAFEAGLS